MLDWYWKVVAGALSAEVVTWEAGVVQGDWCSRRLYVACGGQESWALYAEMLVLSRNVLYALWVWWVWCAKR